MALTGHLSDLSLSELIEFFCNQRKSGRLKVLYPQGPGYFYLQTGSVVDAKIGAVRGIDAVYYALTLPNAKFEFSGSAEPSERSINQPWTQVVLEGLRRLDEGITPAEAFPSGFVSDKDELEPNGFDHSVWVSGPRSHLPSFLSFMENGSVAKRKPLVAGALGVALICSIAVVGIPAGWYKRAKVSVAVSEPVAASASEAQLTSPPTPEVSASETPETSAHPEDSGAIAARRQRERDRARAREAAMLNQPSATSPSLAPASGRTEPANSGPRKVSVTVTYDESGRVVQASGGDPSALRIARQKRFPPGKAGSATVTIPIN
jgi:uncharacterized protein DUF4388